MIQLRDILYQLDIKSLFEVVFLILITIKVCTQKLSCQSAGYSLVKPNVVLRDYLFDIQEIVYKVVFLNWRQEFLWKKSYSKTSV